MWKGKRCRRTLVAVSAGAALLLLSTILASQGIGTYGLLFIAAALTNGLLAENKLRAMANGVVTAVVAVPLGGILWYALPDLAAQGPPTYAFEWDGSNVITPLMVWPLLVSFIFGDLHSYYWLMQVAPSEPVSELVWTVVLFASGIFMACHTLVYFVGLPRLSKYFNEKMGPMLTDNPSCPSESDGPPIQLGPSVCLAKSEIQSASSGGTTEGATHLAVPGNSEHNESL